jgi:magnesium transporter
VKPEFPPTVEVTTYNREGVQRAIVANAQEAVGLTGPDHVTWINVTGLWNVELLKDFGSLLDLHPLVIEDIGTPSQRPKMEEYDEYLLLVFRMVTPGSEGEGLAEEQLSLVLKEGLVITFQEREGDAFEPVRSRIEAGRGRLRGSDASYLMYALVDALVDHYFILLESLDDRIEALEAEVESEPSRDLPQRGMTLRRELVAIRRAALPSREMLSGLLHTDSTLLSSFLRPYLQDVMDHSLHVVDGIEGMRESLSAVMEAYRSNVGMQTNEVMRVLTIVATVFIPMTFVAGVYGMNFEFMPELGLPWAYPVALLAMIGLGVGMLWYFRRRDWL